VVCFFGTLGRQFDIGTVIEAARLPSMHGVRFVICGDGDRRENFESQARGLPNVIFPGWVDRASIRTLMRRSLAGLAPYYNELSFTMSLPNKAIEYLAGGLPLVSSLTGELAALLESRQCGLTYAEGDPQALAASIAKLSSETSLRESMAHNAGLVFEQEFVAENVYGRMLDYLGEVARQGRARQ
jgi:glycosyltransferase involved in cell wall biosynthesis